MRTTKMLVQQSESSKKISAETISKKIVQGALSWSEFASVLSSNAESDAQSLEMLMLVCEHVQHQANKNLIRRLIHSPHQQLLLTSSEEHTCYYADSASGEKYAENFTVEPGFGRSPLGILFGIDLVSTESLYFDAYGLPSLTSVVMEDGVTKRINHLSFGFDEDSITWLIQKLHEMVYRLAVDEFTERAVLKQKSTYRNQFFDNPNLRFPRVQFDRESGKIVPNKPDTGWGSDHVFSMYSMGLLSVRLFLHALFFDVYTSDFWDNQSVFSVAIKQGRVGLLNALNQYFPLTLRESTEYLYAQLCTSELVYDYPRIDSIPKMPYLIHWLQQLLMSPIITPSFLPVLVVTAINTITLNGVYDEKECMSQLIALMSSRSGQIISTTPEIVSMLSTYFKAHASLRSQVQLGLFWRDYLLGAIVKGIIDEKIKNNARLKSYAQCFHVLRILQKDLSESVNIEGLCSSKQRLSLQKKVKSIISRGRFSKSCGAVTQKNMISKFCDYVVKEAETGFSVSSSMSASS